MEDCFATPLGLVQATNSLPDMLPTLARLERGTLSFTKYISFSARATRSALKDDARAKAERLSSGVVGLKFQEWKDGKAASEQKWIVEPKEES